MMKLKVLFAILFLAVLFCQSSVVYAVDEVKPFNTAGIAVCAVGEPICDLVDYSILIYDGGVPTCVAEYLPEDKLKVKERIVKGVYKTLNDIDFTSHAGCSINCGVKDEKTSHVITTFDCRKYGSTAAARSAGGPFDLLAFDHGRPACSNGEKLVYADELPVTDRNDIKTVCPQATIKSVVKIKNQVICTDDYTPVCAVNGITYSNACEADIANIEIAYNGECEIKDDGTLEPIFDNTKTKKKSKKNKDNNSKNKEKEKISVISDKLAIGFDVSGDGCLSAAELIGALEKVSNPANKYNLDLTGNGSNNSKAFMRSLLKYICPEVKK